MTSKSWYGVGVLASLVAGMSAAGAADLAVKAPPVYKAPPVILSDWAGFYLGVHGGYGWGDWSANGLNHAPASVNTKGGLFGGHAGYNWQFGSYVVGVEGDFDGADITGSSIFHPDNPAAFSVKTDELASIRGRAGYIVAPNVLAYATGGAGWGHTKISSGVTPDEDISQWGWVAGAGLEYKFWGNFIARAEYLHYGFDNGSTANWSDIRHDIDVARGGVSYKF